MLLPVALSYTDTLLVAAGTQKSFAFETLQPGSTPNCGVSRSAIAERVKASLIL
jgi:hypothetical protein